MRPALTLLLLLVSGCALAPEGDSPPPVLRVTSFNIRYGTANDGLNSWPLRKELVMQVVRQEAPHVLGVQEALRFQLDELGRAFPQFEELGVGREDGQQAGEYAAILFDRERLRVLETGTFWLSASPEEIASTSWGNTLTRICTWARFEDLQTGDSLHVFNTHWDHRSQNSREKSAELILTRVRELAAGGPAMVLGDFNAGETNPAFRRLLEDERTPLADSFRQVHPQATAVGTFNGFQGKSDGEKIDAVLVSEHWAVLDARIVRPEEGGRWPSDHYPVSASVRQR